MKFTKTITHIISNISVAAILAASAALVAAQTPGNAPTTPPPGTKVLLTPSGSPQPQLQQAGDEDRAPPDATPPDNPTLPGIPGDIPFNAEVEFTDVNLAQAVRKALGKNEGDGPVRVYDLSSPSFTELWLNDLGIQNLTGLEHARFLQKLGINDNNVSDLSPIAGLTSLSDFNASNNQIENLTPLAELTRLTHLNLSANKIDKLTPLQKLTNLSWLSLQNTWSQKTSTFTDLTPLAGLTKLKYLSLTHTMVSDLSPLGDLKDLRSLFVHGTKVTDISIVKNFSSMLSNFILSGSMDTDYTPLESLSEMLHLSFYGGELDLKTVPVAPTVKDLTLGWMTVYNPATVVKWQSVKRLIISRVEGIDDYPAFIRFVLREMPDLEKIIVHHSDIENASEGDKEYLYGLIDAGILDYYFDVADPNLRKVVAKALGRRLWAGTFSAGKAAKVTKLDFRKMDVKSLSGIEHFRNLEYLHGSENQITDVTPLADMTQLEVVSLWNNKIEDVTPLAGLVNLRGLGLTNNPVDDFDSLAGLTKLKWLHIDNNHPTSLEFLSRMTDMWHLAINGWNVPENGFTPIANLDGVQKLTIRWARGVPTGAGVLDLEDLDFDGEERITNLNLTGSKIRNFKEIEKLQNLKHLVLNYCEILDDGADLSSIAELPNLQYLLMDNLKPSDYAPLGALENLKYVRIDYKHRDLDPSTPAGQVVAKWYEADIVDYVVPFHKTDKELEKAIQAALDYPHWKHILVRDLSEITTLDLRGYKVQDFRGLEEATALEEIKVDMGNVADFVQIAKDNAALRDQVEDQNDTIATQETVIDDMADTIAKQSKTIDKQNTEIAQLKKVIAERDAKIEILKDIITVKDDIIAERDATIVKKDKTIADRDATIVKQEVVIAQLQAFRSATKNTLRSVGFNIDGDNSIVDAVKELIEMARTPFVNGWIYDPEQGWLYTDCEIYPLVYSHSTASWHYYALGTCPRLFYNYSTEEWENWDPTHEHTETEVASNQGQE